MIRNTPTFMRRTALGLAVLTMTAIVVAAGTGYPVKLNEFLNGLKQKLTQYETTLPEDRVYMMFDKPFYKPGDDVWFSTFVRDGRRLLKSGKSDIVYVELINPKGNVAQKLKIVAQDGVAKGDFHIDEDLPGGMYKVRAYTKWQENQATAYKFEKDIQVQAVVLPNLKMKLDFERKAYGAGDEVVVDLNLNTNENKPLANHSFEYVATLDGEQLLQYKGSTDAAGKAKLKLRLPGTLESNDGLVNVMIQYNGLTESISRSIPIVLNKVDLAFFPEGGDLVSGLPSKVGFRALNEFGKPADVEGVIIDDQGAQVGTFSSFHQGMGSFPFHPGPAGRTYKAKLTKPEGITQTYDLPEPLARGYVLNVESNQNGTMGVVISSTETEAMNLVAQVRGEAYWMSEIAVKPGRNVVPVPVDQFPMGVCQLTLFDAMGIERCERLAFVNRERQLKVEVKPGKEKYMPREKVTLNVKVTDDRGLPMPAVLAMSVVDDQLISFADDKSGDIISQLTLEQDLKQKVEEPRFYFDKQEPKAVAALDNLMLTAGWRRFVWEEVLSGNPPMVKVQGERAIVAGVVRDGYTLQPIANASVTMPGNNFGMLTDAKGQFSVAGLDMSAVQNLTVTAEGFYPQTFAVADYNPSMMVNLYKPQVYSYSTTTGAVDAVAAAPKGAVANNKQIPVKRQEMAGAGKAGAKEKMMAAEPVENRVPQMRDELKMVPMDEDVEMDFAVAEQEVALADPGIDPERRIKVNPNHDNGRPDLALGGLGDTIVGFWAAGDVKDERFNQMMKADKNAEEQKKQQIRYHRAREFSGPVYAGADRNPKIRNDFRETLYWNPFIKVDRSGKATVEFYASDAITSFRATVEGIGMNGHVGRGESVFFTQLPFTMKARVPVEVASGDNLVVPVTLQNNTDATINGSLHVIHPSGLEPASSMASSVSILAGQTKVLNLMYKVLGKPGKEPFKIAFSGDGHTDAFQQDLKIVSQGFPVNLSFSGKGKSEKYQFVISKPVTGSLSASFTAFPNVVTDLIKGIESILREPYGCFEQTSTSSYPNAMVLSYLKEQNDADPAIMKKANDLLDKGYKRLTSYECSQNGYEWFGSNPPHEALTAYGLMQFSDYSKVYNGVDRGMVDRTAKWLLARRDGSGGFKRDSKALDSFGRADAEITNAYIVYALSEGGYKEVMPEALKAHEKALESKDPYQLALMGNAMYNLGDFGKGKAAVDALIKTQQADGGFTGKKHSITVSNGISLTTETTSLAVMAMIKANGSDPRALQSAVERLVKSRSGAGGFGSTQGTILALKALVAYSKFAKQTAEPGNIEVYVNGQRVSEVSYAAGRKDAVEIKGLEAHLREGKNEVEVRYLNTENPLPYAVAVDYHTSLPASSPTCVVDLETKLSATKVKMGETVRLSATLKNKTNDGQPMTIAIIGLPAGLSAQPWQLKEMQERKVFDFYEIIGNNVVAYYRQMTPGETRSINLDLKADIPGKYTAPASSAYLYYTAENKDWTALPAVEILN